MPDASIFMYAEGVWPGNIATAEAACTSWVPVYYVCTRGAIVIESLGDGARELQPGETSAARQALTGFLNLQIDLGMARLTSQSHLRAGETNHTQRLFGNVAIGRGGLQFSHIIQEQAAVVIRPSSTPT